MSTEKLHHTSKKNRYTIVFVPDEDAANAKSFGFAVWQFFVGAVLLIGIVAAVIWTVVIYTPVGQLLPITSPGLRNQYSREIVELNARMTDVMEELIELRSYNNKLRKVLGEKLVSSDSNNVSAEDLKENESASKNRTEKNIDFSQAQHLSSLSATELKNTIMPADFTVKERPLQFPAIMPAQGYITRGFDPKISHYGLDIAGKSGSLVNAAADGVVIFAGWTYEDGNVVIVSHSGGFMTSYKHNASLLKSVGSHVKRGEALATLGSSGETSQGPHVHFEILKDGIAVDPSLFIMNYNL